ncbi:MAG: tetratricopeptide repeat protein [Thermodesulfobacteriota bacterium]
MEREGKPKTGREASDGFRTGAALGAALAALVLAAWVNSLHAPFVLDDFRSIVENRSIRELSFGLLAPQASTGLFLRPLTNFSFALNFALGGLSPFGYHLGNVLVHMAAALALLALLRGTARISGAGRKETAACAAAAFLWALHPLCTATVTNVAERATALWVLFLFLSLYFLMRAATSERARGYRAAALASLFLGLCAKQDAVAIAPILLCYDAVFLSRGFREALNHRRAFYLAALFLTAAAAATFLAGGGVPATETARLSAFSYAAREPWAVCRYLRLAFWPAGLTLDYGAGPADLPPSPGCALALMALAGVCSYGVLSRRAWWGFCGALFFLALLPSSSFYPLSTVCAEHRAYGPLTSVVSIAAVLPAAAIRFFPAKRGAKAAGLFLCVLLISLLALFFCLTVSRNRDYRSSQAIWEDTLGKTPGNAKAMTGLAEALRDRGEEKRAEELYRKALDLSPDFAPARFNLANLYLGQGHPALALNHFRQALAADPGNAKIMNGMGQALLMGGDFPQAEDLFRQALKLEPARAEAWANLGTALMAQGLFGEAADSLSQALVLNPEMVKPRVNLGVCLLALERPREAREQFLRALLLDPANGAARTNLARANQALEKDTEATNQEREER